MKRKSSEVVPKKILLLKITLEEAKFIEWALEFVKGGIPQAKKQRLRDSISRQLSAAIDSVS